MWKRSVPSCLGLGTLFAIAACDGAPSATPDTAAQTIRAHEIRAHLRFLSDDLMAGRAPGTPGGRLAAAYIATEFEEAGLQPVQGSYFQTVPVVGTTPLPEDIALSFRAGGRRGSPEYLTDFVLWSGDPLAEETEGSGELVFVGYGISAPESDWNDFEGADLDGKILLVLVNDPPAPSSEPDLFGGPAMTYYGRWTYKFEEAARQGALGALMIHTTQEAGYPWSVVRGSWSGEQFSLPPDPEAPAPSPIQGWVTRETAEWVLEIGDLDLGELEARARSRDFTPVATGIQVSARIGSRIRRVETRNVVGLLPGAERGDEIVTLTSHYDHLGVGDPVEGDSIYNGAYDNASGTSLLIEVAEAAGSLSEPLSRSLLFIATAAEEAGLLGAAWYVQNPLFPLSRTVAELNVDGANLWGETDDIIVMGAERSELGAFVEARARQMGLEVAPDAEPEKGYFFRSDHFPFARAGVPALYVEHGRRYRDRPEGWGRQIQEDYVANRYHAPSDEFSESFTFDGAIQQATLLFLTAYDIAQDNSFPNWHAGSEFKAARDRSREEATDGG